MKQTVKYTVKVNGKETDEYKEKIREYIEQHMIPLIERNRYAIFVLDSDNFLARYSKEDLLGKVCIAPSEIVGHVISITTREDECDIEFEYDRPHKEKYTKKYDLSSLRFFLPVIGNNTDTVNGTIVTVSTEDRISQPRLLIDENK